MQPRKTKKADLERQRGTFFLLGLVLSFSAVLLAFNWKTKTPEQINSETVGVLADEDFYIPPATERKKKPEIPAVKEAVIFKLVGNESKIDNNLDFFQSDVPVDFKMNLDNFIYKPEKEETVDEQTIYKWVEIMPEFPGGEMALLSFLNKSIIYPVIAQENNIQGKVYVSFVIDTDGSVTDVRISRSVDTSLDEEALRVVKSMPKWKPGRQGGTNVRVSYTVPINFVLR